MEDIIIAIVECRYLDDIDKLRAIDEINIMRKRPYYATIVDYDSTAQNLFDAFSWCKTFNGYLFWSKIYNSLNKQEKNE